MKINKEKYKHLTTKYQELERQLKEKSAYHESSAAESGRKLAQDNLPRQEGDSLEPYIGPIKSNFKELALECDKEIQAGNEEFQNERDESFAQEQIIENEGKIAEIERSLKTLKIQLERIVEDFDWRKYRVVLGILIVLGFVDVLIDGSSLQSLGFSLIMSYVYGCGIGITVIILSHQIKPIMEKAKRRYAKLGIFIGLSMVLASIFFLLAYFRIDVFNTSIGSSSSSASQSSSILKVIAFTMLNMIIFWGACCLAYFYLPSKADDLKRSKKRELEQKIKQEENIKKLLEVEIKQLKEELHDLKTAREMNRKYGEKMQEWVATMYERAVGIFISENSIHRKSPIPDCFTGATPALFSNPKNQ